jgi:hypothetical protein
VTDNLPDLIDRNQRRDNRSLVTERLHQSSLDITAERFAVYTVDRDNVFGGFTADQHAPK